MSAAIYWRPLKSGKALEHTTAPSSFQEYLENAVARGFPMRITKDADFAALNVARRLTQDSNFQKDIEDLLEALEKHDEIEIWAEW